MCLDVTGKPRLKATEDLVCYKLLFEGQKGPGVLSTAFQSAIVEIGKDYKSDLIAEVVTDFSDDSTVVDIGLHSFVYFDGLQRTGIGFNVIAKCVIPKGSEYYLGHFWGIPCYASDTLRYEEIVYSKPKFDLRND